MPIVMLSYPAFAEYAAETADTGNGRHYVALIILLMMWNAP
jgi:hypothetical protein